MTQITHYDIGDYWRPEASFAVGGVLTDPTTITVKVQDPAGVETLSSATPGSVTLVSTPIARTNTGTYVLTQALDSAGHWYARFEGAGAVVATHTHEAIVDPDPFTNESGVSTRALVSLGETKDWLAQLRIDFSQDEKIVQRINAASEAMMSVAGREFKPNAAGSEARSFDIYYGDACVRTVQIGDLATTSSASTSMTISDPDTGTTLQTLGTSHWTPLPRSRAPWEPVTQIRFLQGATSFRAGLVLNITGYWGFPSVPEDIRHHTMDTVAYWLDRDVVHFREDLGATSGASEGGQTVIVGSQPSILPLPPEAYACAKRYQTRVFA